MAHKRLSLYIKLTQKVLYKLSRDAGETQWDTLLGEEAENLEDHSQPVGRANWSSPHAQTHGEQTHTSGAACSLPFHGWEPTRLAQPCPAPGADGPLHLSHPPTPQRLPFKKPTVMPKKRQKPEPASLRGNTGSTPQSPPSPRGWQGRVSGPRAPAVQGMLQPALPVQVRSGVPAGLWHPPPHAAATHVPRDLSPPCPSDGFMLSPYINPSTLWSKSKAWSTWGPCSSARASLAGVKHRFPGKPTPLSLWISCGFVVSPSANVPLGISG